MKYIILISFMVLTACASYTEVKDSVTGDYVINAGCVFTYCEVPSKLIIGNKKP